jgi:hypothetical protein
LQTATYFDILFAMHEENIVSKPSELYDVIRKSRVIHVDRNRLHNRLHVDRYVDELEKTQFGRSDIYGKYGFRNVADFVTAEDKRDRDINRIESLNRNSPRVAYNNKIFTLDQEGLWALKKVLHATVSSASDEIRDSGNLRLCVNHILGKVEVESKREKRNVRNANEKVDQWIVEQDVYKLIADCITQSCLELFMSKAISESEFRIIHAILEMRMAEILTAIFKQAGRDAELDINKSRDFLTMADLISETLEHYQHGFYNTAKSVEYDNDLTILEASGKEDLDEQLQSSNHRITKPKRTNAPEELGNLVPRILRHASDDEKRNKLTKLGNRIIDAGKPDFENPMPLIQALKPDNGSGI